MLKNDLRSRVFFRNSLITSGNEIVVYHSAFTMRRFSKENVVT